MCSIIPCAGHLHLYRSAHCTGFSFYNQLRHACLSKVPPPHAVVFLDATPQTCRDRITARGRVGIDTSRFVWMVHVAFKMDILHFLMFMSDRDKPGSKIQVTARLAECMLPD